MTTKTTPNRNYAENERELQREKYQVAKWGSALQREELSASQALSLSLSLLSLSSRFVFVLYDGVETNSWLPTQNYPKITIYLS